MRILALLFVASMLFAQESGPGRVQFESRCAACHGADANGGEHAPGILTRLAALNDQQLSTVLRDGLPGKGMPAFTLNEQESRDLVTYLRTLRPPPRRVDPAPRAYESKPPTAKRSKAWRSTTPTRKICRCGRTISESSCCEKRAPAIGR